MGFYVYLIHDTLNNKVYVGKTEDPPYRWKRHLKVASGKRNKEKFYIHRSIAKYGKDNFTFTAFHTLDNEEECAEAEIYWIKYFNANDKRFGYNQTLGGEGCSGRIVSEETREKMRKAAIGRKHTPETIASMSGDNNIHSKLTRNQVEEIRYKYNLLGAKLVSLSKEYNISARTIARAIYNINWHDENYTPPISRKINNKGKPKLTQEKANEIRKLYDEGTSKLELSKLFNVTITNIDHIIANKIWVIK